MKAILLDGSFANDTTGERIRSALTWHLQNRGWNIETIILREKKIGQCTGNFLCWIRTPGVCHLNDNNRLVAGVIAASDLMVYLTPLTFGGYSSALKRMVDHQIQNISPFFTKVEGETHHQHRYQKYPDFLAVGWMEKGDPSAEAIFRHLVQRNAINFFAETHISDVILSGQSDQEIKDSAESWLNALQDGQSAPSAELPTSHKTGNGISQIRRALLLVGSPRRQKSTSNSLGGYLLEQLKKRSIQTETIYLHALLRFPGKIQILIDAVKAADLVTLTFPLYVDSLPAPVIEALEHLAGFRQNWETRPKGFAAIMNCGFPETCHNETALAICKTFAQQAGFVWAGSLALGGGEIVGGVPLVQGGGRTVRIRKSLELAAAALSQGQTIPKAAQDLLEKPVIPSWLYRFIGGFGWKKRAKRYGVEKLLRQQPYLKTNK
jgi:multimeric flavodoxin WrbA